MTAKDSGGRKLFCKNPHYPAQNKISFNMKKFFAVIISGAAAAAALCGCAGETDYCRFISEKRYDSYLYEDDDLRIKIDFSERETPYLSDGYCGDMQKICEIFVKFTESPASVEAELGESGGEMNYMSVTDSFYLSFTGEAADDSAEITLTYGGEERVFTAESVLYDGVMTCEDALECVTQYDESLFETLTDGNNFEGEIYVRLISDGGKCYYYVGVVDREGGTNSFLVDGEKGNIIARRTS